MGSSVLAMSPQGRERGISKRNVLLVRNGERQEVNFIRNFKNRTSRRNIILKPAQYVKPVLLQEKSLTKSSKVSEKQHRTIKEHCRFLEKNQWLAKKEQPKKSRTPMVVEAANEMLVDQFSRESSKTREERTKKFIRLMTFSQQVTMNSLKRSAEIFNKQNKNPLTSSISRSKKKLPKVRFNLDLESYDSGK